MKSIVLALAGTATAGSVLWDGRFNDMASSKDLEKWSWGNQVGAYQYYIHGKSDVTKYANLSPDFKNPADKTSKAGVKITIDGSAKWNSDMWRTELIPQTKAAINKGKVFYHFSMKKTAKNAPSTAHEHQVNFFESHFTEMKYGTINGQQNGNPTHLQWMVGGQKQWSAQWEPEVWHNIAYEIDFDGKSVTYWHSTGADALNKTAGPVKASANSDGKDWHLGVLRLPKGNDASPEDWYFSGVYVESGPITTSVSGPSA
ncbi:hypothetical protein BT63DRAFT_453250 [Microthyrium microscopicum]|uniref:Glycoside hydrolase 131 catalytic N-terminal domain-containing protein n=1 Tax=Microthyrium microscopicum TaxID=703497 RepID=A0A6A6UFC2_9PEZI|nr:hypothetical protein BT63DRAFT_453250 [Microthyrium microscopicum]